MAAKNADTHIAIARPRVFYDGACPLCRREIDHYRRLDRESRLVWIDKLKTQTLSISQYLPRPRERTFSFFKKAENLALITPHWLGFRVLSPSPVEIYEGRLIDYQIRLSGVPVHWRSLISRYDPPTLFVDEQVIGPYAIWRHLHRFESVPGGTRLIDEVDYRLTDWLPGHSADLINHIYTKPRLQ